MTQKKVISTPIGPPQALVSRIEYLNTLLVNLPTSLPLNPEASTYHFGLDKEDLDERGYFGALSHNLEICLGTFNHQTRNEIHFTERGKRLLGLISVIKTAVKKMSESDRVAFQDAWLERLIEAAKRDGARIPPKRKHPNPTDDIVTTPDPHILSSSTSVNMIASSSTASRSNVHVNSEPPLKRHKSDTLDSSFPATVDSSPCDDDDDDEIVIVRDNIRQARQVTITSEVISTTEKKKTVKQGTLDGVWRKTSSLMAEEKRALAQAARQKDEEKRKAAAADAERLKARKEEREKQLNKERQQRHRDRLKAQKQESTSGTRRKAPVFMADGGSTDGLQSTEIAATSRAGYEDWRNTRNGKQGGAKQAVASRTNWYHPFLWIHIDSAMRKADWSPGAAEKALKRTQPKLFKAINRGTIWKWVSRENPRTWSETTLRNIKEHHSLTGSGRTGVLAKRPDITEKIKKALQDLRNAKVPINISLTRAYMVALIEENGPELMNENFKCSESYVRSFLQSVMNWTPRTATRAAAHIPADVDVVCTRTFFRLVYAMKWEKIRARLLINVDQMGTYVLPSNSRTFHDKGANQVDAIGKEEKRAYTLLVASTPAGDILPFQQVWAGKTKKSLPRDTAPGMDEAKRLGFHFTAAASESSPRSHFSTLKTMKEWIKEIYLSYVKQVIEEDGLDEDQKSILYIDCYPVHAGVPFKTFVFDEHPNIILIFVPRNCTPVFQPADVGLQRPIKHSLKQSLFEFLANESRRQIESGLKPEDVKITTSLESLRDASVMGLVKVFKFLQSLDGRDLIKKAWRKSEVNGTNWCLSEGCLTSKEAEVALKDFLRSDSTLRDEIDARMGTVLGLEPDGEPIEAEMDHDAIDDTDIPLEAVILETVGGDDNRVLEIPTADEQYLVRYVKRTNDGLVAGGDHEDVWAYDDDGTRWSELQAIDGPSDND